MQQLEYITVRDAANKWKISEKDILSLCQKDKIIGVAKLGDKWIIPKNANKPKEIISNNNSPKPFLKWAGGKTQLLPTLRENYPNDLGTNITKYCEPMVGAGAVLFDIINNYSIDEVLICDCNYELINTYNIIKNDVGYLVELLSGYESNFLSLDNDNRKLFYYDKREKFNKLMQNRNNDNQLERASLFLFLNKTCFNGLYRVNKKGLFNVPMGSYKNPTICDSNNLFMVSEKLKNVNIIHGDFSDTSDFIDDKTFVYIDPPYRPLNKTSEFTSYNSLDFNDDEQIRLAKYFYSLDLKKAKVLLSNSDPKNTDDEDYFFDELYRGYCMHRVDAKRSINSKGNLRGCIKELLIKNYWE